MPQVLTKVHGGIITDEMLTGKMRFFEMTGPFAYTISDGTVIVPGMPTFGGSANLVGNDKPVPRSAAELAMQLIMTRCNICQIQIIDATTIQFAIENTSNGWDDHLESVDDFTLDAATNMTTALNALGSAITVPDNTSDGAVVDFTAITVTEKDFELVP